MRCSARARSSCKARARTSTSNGNKNDFKNMEKICNDLHCVLVTKMDNHEERLVNLESKVNDLNIGDPETTKRNLVPSLKRMKDAEEA